jgi:hypothetical protein
MLDRFPKIGNYVIPHLGEVSTTVPTGASNVRAIAEAIPLDLIERITRQNVLLGLIAELYEKNPSDVIAVKEWLEAKLREPAVEEDQPRVTNHYLCPKDIVRWDANWSCMCNDRCPTCDAVVEPFATTRNADQSETIHNQAVYNRANVVAE